MNLSFYPDISYSVVSNLFIVMIVSIQGQAGSYHDIASKYLFGNQIKQLQRETFAEVFGDAQSGRADKAVVAIENSLVGSINEVYDLLLKDGLQIEAELYMRISHNLIGLHDATLDQIKTVYSHPMALLQCEAFLDAKLPGADVHERHDTAESVEFVAQQKDSSQAAIASATAAKMHGLKILQHDIETDKHNYTRFIVLSPKGSKPKVTNKTSIVIATKNIPGALYNALGVFANRNINLSKLESRPIIGKGWNYHFYIDFEAGVGDSKTTEALAELKKYASKVAILGSYQKGEVLE